MIQHAGYQTIDLQTFVDFVQGKPVDLPPRPLLLTFDDARADSWTGARRHPAQAAASTPSCSSTSAASTTAIPST